MKKVKFLNIKNRLTKAIINYKKMRTIRWHFEDDILYISCPYIIKDEELEKIISCREPKKKLPKAFGEDFCYIFGVKEALDHNYIKIDGHFYFFDKKTFYKDINKFFLSYIETRMRYFEKVMEVKKPYIVRTKILKTLYGSNSRKTHTITINTFLIHFSKDIIDSVVIHELAHEFERNHSIKFYNKVYKYCPNYDEIHKALSKNIFEGIKYYD
jgi:predicted metal-dependent hydrolase